MTLGLGLKDLEAKGQLYHVGTRFKALIIGVSIVVASEFSCNFFRILSSVLEQCAVLGIAHTQTFW